MGCELDSFLGRPCDWPGCREHESVWVVVPVALRHLSIDEGSESKMSSRCIGLDVHRDFCEVAVWEDGKLISAGRIDTRPEALLEGQDPSTPARRAQKFPGMKMTPRALRPVRLGS